MGEDLFSVSKNQYKCERCRDTGRIISKAKVVSCPECKGNVQGKILDDNTITEMQKDIVPDNFKDKIFDIDKIMKDPRIDQDIKRDNQFNSYLESISTIYNAINTNTELKYSILITAPQGMGKTSLVYSCLNAAIRNGKTVAPYLDSLELNDMLLDQYGRHRETLEQVSTAEICFMKIPHTTSIGAMRALMIMIDRRARRGLPTIVTSRFDVFYLYRIDFNLESLFVTDSFGDVPYDFSRLRVITSVYPNIKHRKSKYDKNR